MNSTTMRYIAARQARGDVVALVDVVGDFRPDALRAQGVELSELLVAQPATHNDLSDVIAGFMRSRAVEVLVLHGAPCPSHLQADLYTRSSIDVVEILPPPTFNLYTQAPGWRAYHVLARGASAWNCAQWICAHANHGEGERLMRAFYALPDGGEEFACAWIVQGGSGEAQVHPDVTIPVRFHAAARRAQGS